MVNDLNIRIKINSDTKQLEITQDGFEKISGSAKKTANDIQNFDSKLDKTINTVKDFAIAYISINTAMAAGKYFVENADGLNRLDGRLKLATDSTMEFHSQSKELLAIAKETHSPLQNITDLYIKMDPALEKLGATTKTTNQIVENFSEGLKLGGANTEETSSAILQFAQAMGSGKLAGDEFKSMAEASPKLMEYLAQGLKVPQGELKNMAEAGELTTGRVSAALLAMTDEIHKDFKQLPKTVGDAAVDFATEASVMVHEIDKATGATAALADGIDFASDLISNKNGVLDEFTDTVMTGGIAIASIGVGLGVSRLAMAGYASTTGIATVGQLGFTTAIIAGTVATKAKAAATGLLRIAMLNLPLIAVAAGVGAIASHFLTAARDANLLTDSLAKTNEELMVMGENQLLVQKATIDRGISEKLLEIQESSFEIRRAKQSGANAEEMRELRAHYEELSGEYKRMTDQKAAIENVAHKSKVVAPAKDENIELKKQIEKLLNNGSKEDKPKKGKTPAQIEAEELRIVTQRLDAQKSAQLEYYTTIGDYASVWAIKTADEMQQMADSKMLTDAQMVNVFNTKHNQFLVDEKKRNEEASADQRKQIESRMAAEKEFYSSLFQLSGDYYTSESIKIGEQYNEWEKAGLDKLQLQEWLNTSMLALDKRRYDDQLELAKKTYQEENKFWLDLFGDVEKAMDNQLFDAMVGKWTSFGNWFKDFWSSLSTSVMRAVSSKLSTSITGSLQEMLIGSETRGSAADLLFITASAGTLGYGSTLSADQVAQLGGTFGQVTTTSGGSIIDHTGKVIEAGKDLTSIASNYATMSKITESAMSATSWLSKQGLISGTTAGSMDGFVYGATNPFSMAGTGGATGAGAMAGSVAIAAAGGYAFGKLGDKVFGADTKAANYGAAGAAAGAVIGSVVPVIGTAIGAVIGGAIGSAIGGAFGTKKLKASGYAFEMDATSSDSAQSYADYQKKSWFSNKKWTDFKALTGEEKRSIDSIFGTYNYLLDQLGNTDDIVIQAGKYKELTFSDQLAKNFITMQTGIEQTVSEAYVEYIDEWTWDGRKIVQVFEERSRIVANSRFDEIYGYWKDYAKSIDATVTEALSTSISSYMSATRSFEEWRLGSGSVDQLKFRAEYLQKDKDALEKQLGIYGVSVENYLTRYDEAIKGSFDPQTIENWKQFGSVMMSAVDAQKAYEQALLNTADSAASAALSLQKTAQGLILSDSSTLDAEQKTDYAKKLLNQSMSVYTATGSSSSRSDVEQYAKEYLDNLRNSETDATEYRRQFTQVMKLLGSATPYADGGIVSSPTWSVVGERGAEAVIPLKNGSVPVNISGGNDNGEMMEILTTLKTLVRIIERVTQGGAELRTKVIA